MNYQVVLFDFFKEQTNMVPRLLLQDRLNSSISFTSLIS